MPSMCTFSPPSSPSRREHQADFAPLAVPITLVPEHKHRDKRHLVLTGDKPILIGRASKSENKDLHAAATNALFDCPVMSRRHAELHANPWAADGEQVTITDLHSMHGTFVNGRSVQKGQPFTLRSGDVIRLGNRVSRGDGIFAPSKDIINLEHATTDRSAAAFDGIELSFSTDDTSHPSLERSEPVTRRTFVVPPGSDDEDSDYASEVESASAQAADSSSAPTTPESNAKPGSQQAPIELDSQPMRSFADIFLSSGPAGHETQHAEAEIPSQSIQDSCNEHHLLIPDSVDQHNDDLRERSANLLGQLHNRAEELSREMKLSLNTDPEGDTADRSVDEEDDRSFADDVDDVDDMDLESDIDGFSNMYEDPDEDVAPIHADSSAASNASDGEEGPEVQSTRRQASLEVAEPEDSPSHRPIRRCELPTFDHLPDLPRADDTARAHDGFANFDFSAFVCDTTKTRPYERYQIPAPDVSSASADLSKRSRWDVPPPIDLSSWMMMPNVSSIPGQDGRSDSRNLLEPTTSKPATLPMPVPDHTSFGSRVDDTMCSEAVPQSTISCKKPSTAAPQWQVKMSIPHIVESATSEQTKEPPAASPPLHVPASNQKRKAEYLEDVTLESTASDPIRKPANSEKSSYLIDGLTCQDVVDAVAMLNANGTAPKPQDAQEPYLCAGPPKKKARVQKPSKRSSLAVEIGKYTLGAAMGITGTIAFFASPLGELAAEWASTL